MDRIDGIDILRALIDAKKQAELRGVRIQRFKLSLDEFSLLSKYLLRHLPIAQHDAWLQRPTVDGVEVQWTR